MSERLGDLKREKNNVKLLNSYESEHRYMAHSRLKNHRTAYERKEQRKKSLKRKTKTGRKTKEEI